MVLESSKSFPEVPWEVSIWHGLDDPAKWTAFELAREGNPSLVLKNGASSAYLYTFTGTISIRPHYRNTGFTIRFRTHANASWQWENEVHGTKDGQLILQSNRASKLQEVVDMPSSFIVEDVRSQTPDVSVWLIKSKIPLPNATSGDAGTELMKLGKIKDQQRYFALIRKWAPWLGPAHGLQKFHLTEDALLCSFLNSAGKHIVFLALNGIDDLFTLFKSNDYGDIMVAARNDGPEPAQVKVLAAIADDFELANAAVIYAARDYVSRMVAIPEIDSNDPTHLRSESIDEDTVIISKDVKVEWLEDWYDGLAYCTWNSLGQDLTEEKLMAALESLQDAGIKVSSLIIDDNWQSLDNPGANQFKRGWTEFEADSRAFPNGLKHTAKSIRTMYPNIQHIAVWHALCGYWGWISPNGKIAKEYKTTSVRIDDSLMPIKTGDTAVAVDPDDIRRMYDDFYSFLASSGIDSVKTDVQFALDILASTQDRRHFTTAYQNAWLIAMNKHFAAKAISCMSQIPQIIFHSLLPKTRPTILFRNSDDFFPDVPDSHPYHIFWNAHNALLVQHLNVLPDWDMFQTAHPYAGFHAAGRCISGGPIYITDTPGQHSIDIITQMTARNPRGQTIILRPSVVGKTLDIYNDYNERHILRVGCYNGPSQSGTGIIGLFNIGESTKALLLPLKDFPGIIGSQNYIIRSHVHGTVSSPMSLDTKAAGNLIFASLPTKGYDILTAYPLHPIHGTPAQIAPLGLPGRLTGAVALASTTITQTENNQRVRIRVALRALGVLGIYISDLEDRELESGFLILILGRVVPLHTVQKKGKILQIDVERAWDEMELDAGWSNEVSVEIFMSV